MLLPQIVVTAIAIVFVVESVTVWPVVAIESGTS